MKDINILFGVDGAIDYISINMGWPRFLDEDTMNFRVFVQFIYNSEQVFLRSGCGQVDTLRIKTEFFGGFF